MMTIFRWVKWAVSKIHDDDYEDDNDAHDNDDDYIVNDDNYFTETVG